MQNMGQEISIPGMDEVLEGVAKLERAAKVEEAVANYQARLRKVGNPYGIELVHARVALAYLDAATEIMGAVNRAVLEVRQALDDDADATREAQEEVEAGDFADFFDGTSMDNPNRE